MLKICKKLQEKRIVFVKILAIIIPENGAKVSKIKCLRLNQQTLSSFEMDSLEVFDPIIYLKNGDDLSEYGIAAKVVELLGHTKGSIGVEIEDNLFVGDALMNMFYPTVSMLYVDEQEMLLSAKYISELGEKTIYFGHGKPKRNREWVK